MGKINGIALIIIEYHPKNTGSQGSWIKPGGYTHH